MTKNITVVIPLYNKRSTIRRSVMSVIDQICDGDKLVVVDDGSTDGSREEIKDLIGSELVLLSQDNQGVSAARNRGVEYATTEHVAFLDADDYWLPGALSQIKSLITDFPDCVIYSLGHIRVEPGKVVDTLSRKKIVGSLASDGLIFIKRYAREQLINSSTSCVKKKYLNNVGGFPVGARSGEDIYVWLRMALSGRAAYNPTPLVVVERDPPHCQPERDVVPFHYKWFANKDNLNSLSTCSKVAVRKFFFFRGINQCLGDIAAGRRAGAFKKALWCAKINPLFHFVIPVVILLPGSLLNLISHIDSVRRARL